MDSAPARVVNVASDWADGLDLDDPEFRRRHSHNDAAYRQSSQADRILSVAFAERLKDLGVIVNVCHLGDVVSNLSRNLGFGGHETADQGTGARCPVASVPTVRPSRCFIRPVRTTAERRIGESS